MATETIILLGAALFLVAMLYSTVGHAGASGYIAAMTLFGMNVAQIRPTALVLNIFVASVTAFQFWRAGHFSFRLFFPFALTSVPLAYLGGYVNVPVSLWQFVLGIVLILSAIRFFLNPGEAESVQKPGLMTASLTGGSIGLLSGFTGTGGGIFLTPVMLLMRWAKTKETAAVSAMFILVNSMAGLAGNFTATKNFPSMAYAFLGCTIAGGMVGSFLGSTHFSARWIKRLLAVVLSIAGVKLMFW